MCLVVAPDIDYGYQLFRPAGTTGFRGAAQGVGTGRPHDGVLRLAVPTRADACPRRRRHRRDILGFVFSNAASSGMKGVYVYGVADWGYGGATNYVVARLAWNPHADAHALVEEFYRRAYGPASGEVMKQLNDRLEGALERFYLTHPKATYSLTPEMLVDVYARLYPDIERSYALALERSSDPAARSRLEMFGRNLIAAALASAPRQRDSRRAVAVGPHGRSSCCNCCGNGRPILRRPQRRAQPRAPYYDSDSGGLKWPERCSQLRRNASLVRQSAVLSVDVRDGPRKRLAGREAAVRRRGRHLVAPGARRGQRARNQARRRVDREPGR